MEVLLKKGQAIEIRKYSDKDFLHINDLNAQEKWNNLVENHEHTKNAWNHSNVAFVAEMNGQVIGYIRGLTDTAVTLYVCELLISGEYRGLGIGEALLQYVHDLYPNTRMEMLASQSSHTYYEKLGFRTFYGYRKTHQE